MSFSGGMIGVDSFVCLDLSSLSDMPASSNVVPQNGFVRRSAAMKIVKHHCRFLDGLPSPPSVTIPSWNCGEAHPNSADLGVCWNSLCIAFCVSQVARYGPHFWDDLESVKLCYHRNTPLRWRWNQFHHQIEVVYYLLIGFQNLAKYRSVA